MSTISLRHHFVDSTPEPQDVDAGRAVGLLLLGICMRVIILPMCRELSA
ncbi:hypothetical protein N9V90_02270 [Endozoicomonas sp.]|nr:hypothetical protein [Endozoicomonas sp.]